MILMFLFFGAVCAFFILAFFKTEAFATRQESWSGSPTIDALLNLVAIPAAILFGLVALMIFVFAFALAFG